MNRVDSRLDSPTDLTFGPDGRAYIVDWNNHMVRRVEHDQTLVRVAGTEYEGDGSPEMEDRLPVCNPQGAPGNTVALNHPTQAAFGPDGLLYIAAWHNNKIRTLDPDTGIVKTLAGNFYGFSGDGGPACNALFNQPSSLAFGTDGTMYVADQRNVRLRTIGTDSTIQTIAGDGHEGNVGDGGPASGAEFGWDTVNTPKVSGSVIVNDRTLYIADSGNHRIRRINLDTNVIDCIAGASAQAGYSGDGGSALGATFNWPSDLALGPDGRLYIADRLNHAIRAIDMTSGTITTVVGDGSPCDPTTAGCADRAPALQMELNTPYGVTFDAAGALYIADTGANRIVKVAL
jgi:sugar lactone lactonase YvrE